MSYTVPSVADPDSLKPNLAFEVNPNPVPGFWILMTTNWEKPQMLQEKPSALKRECPALQRMHLSKFFLFLWAYLTPGSEWKSGFGSRDPIESLVYLNSADQTRQLCVQMVHSWASEFPVYVRMNYELLCKGAEVPRRKVVGPFLWWVKRNCDKPVLEADDILMNHSWNVRTSYMTHKPQSPYL